MAQTSLNTFDSLRKRIDNLKLQESYAGLVLGAIVVIILGLLIANYFVKSRGQIGIGESTSQSAGEIVAQTHKVAEGESLSIIANKVYGSYDYWPVLASVNNITNPNLIFVDEELKLPAKSEADDIKAQMGTTSYEVKGGDTLFLIAEKMYGDGSKWVLIDSANKVGRLPNGNPLIYAGSTLTIPR